MYEEIITALRFHGSALSLEAADVIEELRKDKNRKRGGKIEDVQSVTVSHIPAKYQIVQQIDLTQDSIEKIADAVVRKLTAEDGE